MKYRKKSVLVDALQWTGANYADMESFLKSPRSALFTGTVLYLLTGEAEVYCRPGTWVIRSEDGRCHSLPDYVFQQVYEAVETFHHPV